MHRGGGTRQHANFAIKDVPELCDPSLQEELALYPYVGFSHSEPLMLMQVTVFSCGGVIVGLTCNHRLCDGSGLMQFFQVVGELAHGLTSTSIIPVREGDSLELGLCKPFASIFQTLCGLWLPCNHPRGPSSTSLCHLV
jgi:hypothetical protein